MSPDAFTPLRTDRLDLSPGSEEALDFLHRLWTDPDVRRFLWDDRVITLEEARAAVGGCRALWILRDRRDGEGIGFCALRDFDEPPRLELIYGLQPGRWREGLATEASVAALHYAFDEMKVGRVFAGADAPNLRSLRVIERLGMAFEGQWTIGGVRTLYYSIDAETFRRRTPPG